MQIGKVFVVHPAYGGGDSKSHRAFWVGGVRQGDKSLDGRLIFTQHGSSLLAGCFNSLWTIALNLQEAGEEDITHFIMLHDDVTPDDGWITTLLEDLRDSGADLVSAVVTMKTEMSALTSTAIDNPSDRFLVERRLTLQEVNRLPQIFDAQDCGFEEGRMLLVNSGCWVCHFTRPWRHRVRFTIDDEIRFILEDDWQVPGDLEKVVLPKGTNLSQDEAAELPPVGHPDRPRGRWRAFVDPEDWNFSRQLQRLGCKVKATRRVRLTHQGNVDYPNYGEWGQQSHDENLAKSPIKPAIEQPIPPHPAETKRAPYWPSLATPDVRGWLSDAQGKRLSELAAGKDVLELGSYAGRSTIWMAKTAREVVAVDTFRSEMLGGEDTYTEFRENLAKYGGLGKVDQITCTFAHAMEQLRKLGRSFDMIFIDGAHDYESVLADARGAMRLLRTDGLLAFHDYDHSGVKMVVDGMTRDLGFNRICQVGSLVVLRINIINRNQAERLSSWLEDVLPGVRSSLAIATAILNGNQSHVERAAEDPAPVDAQVTESDDGQGVDTDYSAGGGPDYSGGDYGGSD